MRKLPIDMNRKLEHHIEKKKRDLSYARYKGVSLPVSPLSLPLCVVVVMNNKWLIIILRLSLVGERARFKRTNA